MITGDGDLDISPVYDHIEIEKPTKEKKKQTIIEDQENDVKVGKDIVSNEVTLNGYICKKPIYRKTPFGREISDILLAVNRAYNCSRRKEK